MVWHHQRHNIYLLISKFPVIKKTKKPVITAIHVFDGFENVQLCTCYEYMTKTARYSVIYKLCWHIKKWHTDNYVKTFELSAKVFSNYITGLRFIPF